MAGKGIYTDFWYGIVSGEVLKGLRKGAASFSIDVSGLKELGDRLPTNPYSYRGTLRYKYVLPVNFTNSAPIRDLKQVIKKYSPIKHFLVNDVRMAIAADERLHIQVQTVDLKQVIAEYKQVLQEKGLDAERYKWEEIGNNHWDLQASDFMAMVKKINFHNLIYKNAKSVLYNDLAGRFEHESRMLFQELFNDSTELQVRIDRFRSETSRLYRTLYTEYGTHQDERTISSYLAYYNPRRYTLFKNSFYGKFCRIQGIKTRKAGQKYTHYLDLLEAFITNFIANDEELLQLVNQKKSPKSFDDPNHLLLAQDILYTILDGGKEVEDDENDDDPDSSPTLYHVTENSQKTMKLNTILYGPPGTGKTYHTLNKALLALGEKIEGISRKTLKAIFDKKIEEGQVVFTSFHQSLSYEDFIEGIKPQEPKNDQSVVTYEIEDGIFKRLCLTAEGTPELKQQESDTFKNARFYKMSLGGKNNPEIHDWCIQNNCISLGWGEDKNFEAYQSLLGNWTSYRNKFVAEYPDIVKSSRFNVQALFMFQNMKVGDIVVISRGNHIIDAIGRITGDYYWDDSAPFEYYQFRKVEWMATHLNQHPSFFFSKKISQQSIYEFFDADIKKESFIEFFKEIPKGIKPYVLIIDEINRGNISQIFGELITLIEDGKRAGQQEALSVTLPYSKESFSVPSNLYIIGTMNTADRSVDALDTALRRRFVFERMPPQAHLLDPYHCFIRFAEIYQEISWADWKKSYTQKALAFYQFFNITDITIGDSRDVSYYDLIEAKMFDTLSGKVALLEAGLKLDPVVDLQLLLTTLNKRLTLLKDQDHQIGHAYFIAVESVADLMDVFRDSLIPLLQEFFFNDYKKLRLILGNGFFELQDSEVVFAIDEEADFYDQEVLTLKSTAFETEINFLNAIKGMRM